MMWRTALILLLPGISSSAYAEWFYDADAGLTYDDNITRAESAPDIEKDTLLSLGLKAGRSLPLASGQSLTVLGHFKYIYHTDFSDLSSARPGITLRYRHKSGLGPFAPRFGVSSTVEYIASREDLRDSWRYRAGLSFNKRLNDFWDIGANTSYTLRRMQDVPSGLPFPTDVFDQKNFSVSFHAGYAATERWFLSAAYRYDHGDVDSVATAPNPRFVQASSARILDPTFGPSKVLYKLDADSHAVIFDANLAIDDAMSLTIGYERLVTDSVGDIEYDSNIFRLTLLRAF